MALAGDIFFDFKALPNWNIFILDHSGHNPDDFVTTHSIVQNGAHLLHLFIFVLALVHNWNALNSSVDTI